VNVGGTGINFYTANEEVFGGAVFPTDTSLVIWSNSAPNNYLVLQPSWGNTGIGTYSPDAKLHVRGTVILGTEGTVVTNVIKATVVKDIPSVAANSSTAQSFAIINASPGSSVVVSPESALADGLIIAYARVSSPGFVEVKFTNITGSSINPASMDFYFTVIE
jgi:hypothetical protein